MASASNTKEFKVRLYEFTLKLIDLIDSLPKKDVVSWRLGDQLLRSGTSVIGNYIEGKAASSRKDFTNYLNTSLKSSKESLLWICLLRDSKRLDKKNCEWFIQELSEYEKIFASSIITLKKGIKKEAEGKPKTSF